MYKNGVKTCPACLLQDVTFASDKSLPDGLSLYCKTCKNEKYRAWYNKSADKARAAAKVVQRRLREKDPEKFRARAKANVKANPEKYRLSGRKAAARWRKAHPDLYRQRIDDWREKNPTKAHQAQLRRKQLKHRARGVASPAHVASRIAFFGGLCAYCAERPYEHIDHAIALYHGGTNWPANLRPACARCNLSKGTKTWRLVSFEKTDVADVAARENVDEGTTRECRRLERLAASGTPDHNPLDRQFVGRS